MFCSQTTRSPFVALLAPMVTYTEAELLFACQIASVIDRSTLYLAPPQRS